MYNDFPPNHGLPDFIQQSPLIRRNPDGLPQLTHAQYEGIRHGAANGQSILLVAPTSSGKTDVGLLAIASWLRNDPNYSRRAIYLVSHRALARQKHKDLLKPEFLSALDIDAAELVVSNGDITVDGNGTVPEDALSARLLIATYEKFLALKAASGHQADMTNCCVVADECQLIGDQNRGRDVEILLTLIKRANCGQFVGLSAVMSAQDIGHFSDWLELQPVVVTEREVPLAYELRTETSTVEWRTDGPEQPSVSPQPRPRGTTEILRELARSPELYQPVAVFCMSKPRVKELALHWARICGVAEEPDQNTRDLFGEVTANGESLAAFLPHKFAMHSTDLIDTERALVEERLESNQIDVVFATSTLAQGLNFPFKTVLFDHWARWDSGLRQHVPITRSEFRNMAGRAGRLGMGDAQGKVILFSYDRFPDRVPAGYLSNDLEDLIAPHILPEWFDLIALQLVSAKITSTYDALLEFLSESLSGHLMRDANQNFDAYVRDHLAGALEALRGWGFVVGEDALSVTELGRAVARSGLQPKTAYFFVEYVAAHREFLLGLLPPGVPLDQLPVDEGDGHEWAARDSDLVFLIAHLVSCSPEYDDPDTKRRWLPYPLDVRRESERAVRLNDQLTVRPWDTNVTAVNASEIVADWVRGTEMRTFEAKFDHDRYPLTAGQVNGMLRDQASFISGFADVLEALSSQSNALSPIVQRVVPSEGLRREFRRLLRRVRQLAMQVIAGVPEDVLWMLELETSGGEKLLKRSEILAFRRNGISSMEDLLGGAMRAQFDAAMNEASVPNDRRTTIRPAVRAARVRRTEGVKERLIRVLSPFNCQDVVVRFFEARETEFEGVLKECLECLDISILQSDGDDALRFPDFVVEVVDGTPVVLESKSKQGDHEVQLGEATDVGGKAAAHGLNRNPMVTICQPYLATDVPRKIIRAQDLSVVNAEDVAQAFAAVKLERLNKERFHDWLTTPGQPRFRDLFGP